MCKLLLPVLLVLATPGWCSWPAGPSFVDPAVNVTVSEGSHTFLPCRVANLGDRSVLHPANTDEWTLHIRHAQPGDGGWYECQVNSDPKITTPVLLIVRDKSFDDPFYMHELEATDNNTQVHIEGAHERYIQRGSILAITCTVDHPGRTGPRQVAWYQGASRLHYDSPRGGIALQTEKTPSRTVSRLKLSAVTPADSGRYSCRPDTGGFVSVTVHIQSDQPQAAVHQGSHSACLASAAPLSVIVILITGHLLSLSSYR